MLDRAIRRGALRVGLDIEIALFVLVGPIFFRLRMVDLPQVKQEIPGIIDTILPGLRP